ncbi:hypothetical protein PVK06_047432 [Gossypium arboreum]|uniref:Myosin heavy chain kinase B-like n=1 Tax=Gossypium arboreum TaxID=29729 RepID=A0ABR0MF67_GOSAR|nr:hypothetical protein PVK06_047432 [Gossypium arboreum]
MLTLGSDRKNIRVWKNLKEFNGFKSNSGLVKTIVIVGAKIFTGHQDGKIRVWKVSVKNPGVHKRAGTLLSLKEILKSSIKPSNYIEVKRQRSLWIKHSDAVSCLSLNEEHGLLYGLAHGGVLKAHVGQEFWVYVCCIAFSSPPHRRWQLYATSPLASLCYISVGIPLLLL